jgi:hypothetical protein
MLKLFMIYFVFLYILYDMFYIFHDKERCYYEIRTILFLFYKWQNVE